MTDHDDVSTHTDYADDAPPSLPNMTEHLRAFHWGFPRYKEVEAGLNDLIDQMVARRDLAGPVHPSNRDEQDLLLVTAETGSGKSYTIQRALAAALAPYGNGAPLKDRTISVKCPSPFTSKELARRILNALRIGPVEVDSGASDADLWSLVHLTLQSRRILLVHLDEFQRWRTDRTPGGRDGRGRGVRRLAEILNDLLTSTTWPVSLIVSGMPEVADLWGTELFSQVRRRTYDITFEQMSGAYVKAMNKAITQYAAMGSVTPSFADGYQVELRLILASRKTVGVALEMIQEAVRHAVKTGDGILTDKDFAKVFARRHRALAANNPFLANDWKSLVIPKPKNLEDIEDYGLKAKKAGDAK